MEMADETGYPCPCGGKLKSSRKRVVQEGIDCGVLDVSECKKCGEEYLPDYSMRTVENRLKAAGLWGVERKEVNFWKSGNSVTIRLPTEVVQKLGLNKIKKGHIYQEGAQKLAIEF
jgi:hypothetical protein